MHSRANEGRQRSAALDAGRLRVQDSDPDRAYRAACARRECERRLHLVRRRNLTNPVSNGTAL